MANIDPVNPVPVEKAALVALLRLPKARWSEVAIDILECGGAVRLLETRLGSADTLFSSGAVEAALTDAAQDVAQWESEGMGVHAFFDKDYPAPLRDIHQLPPVIFTRGELSDDRRSVAVVGTRQASERGLDIARTVATTLAQNGVTVVSGLAAGIDSAAHTAALAARGRTVAVIGTGIRRSYPAKNSELQERICNEGLVLSQFWPDAPPTKQSFPMRNAVMSGYAAATVVVEAPWKSGARIQARLALQHGRPVVMPDDLLQHDWAREYAEYPGVFVVHDPDELLRVVDKLIAEVDPDGGYPQEIPRLAV
ncbi:DNA-processing protein DprA [Kribbella sp. NPDC051587]|uniref:DNA-processing protein DprA n=1 Tax=Kribbella sp. NPDC051587 TaxID=3364119 RepID=UPI0037BB49A3